MIEKSAYRFGEYQITEYDDGVLRWAAHHGFGEQRSGRCFIVGDILAIGQFIHEEIGYLKGEFLDRLEELPIWNRTEYYCFAFELLDVSSGKNLNQDCECQILSNWGDNRSRWQPLRDEALGTFRLGKYKVTVGSNRQISWQALEGRDRVVGGQCIIQSGILFIGPKECETGGQSGREFFSKPNKIAPWNRTRIWSHSSALRPCQSPPQTGQFNVVGQRDRRPDHGYHEDTINNFFKGPKKILKSPWPPGIKFKIPSLPRSRLLSSLKLRKPSWSLPSRKEIRFMLLIPLLLVGLLFGLMLSLLSVKETSHRHHSSEEHHHR
jgi:hypothetical protein